MSSESQKLLHENDEVDKDLIERSTGQQKTVSVPILKPENFGPHMAVDDKNIGGEGYTILSNKETGKIAALIMTTKHKLLEKVLHRITRTIRWNVKTLSRDLAESYNYLGSTCFPQAVQIADKFHIVKLALEAVQSVRTKYRQEVLNEIRKKTRDPKKIFSNGDTIKQLLARGRYLLFKFETEWTDSQAERAVILFQEFPEIERAYKHIQAFRAFYNTKVGNTQEAQESLMRWYKRVENTDITEIKNFETTLRNNESVILEYFENGHTNAFAESLNAKIQRFVISNYGIHNRNFFHFRLMKIFS